MRTTRVSLTALAAALIVAAPALMAAPAYARGEGGEMQYQAYLANRAKTEAMYKAAIAKQTAATTATDSDDTVWTLGTSHSVHAAPAIRHHDHS